MIQLFEELTDEQLIASGWLVLHQICYMLSLSEQLKEEGKELEKIFIAEA